LCTRFRREIVERLSGGATTVGEASRDLGVSKPTITRHLKMLEEAGVVTRGDRRTEPPAGAATGHAR
jgi:DNA-binding transcriptional ArsR family regulator